jgi:hypothetical protein
MGDAIDTIHVSVEYFDGQAEGDIGTPYYVASCNEIVAVTDAQTLDELLINIREMIDCFLDEPDPVAELGIVRNPRIVITLELPYNYAQTA